ncbi:MAG: SDR family NAD(P)-dependent oxidoreductase, partial [Pseudomonadota bacterium]
QKLAAADSEVGGNTKSYRADLSNRDDVEQMASALLADHDRLDIVVNNAGVLKSSNPILEGGLDIRFVVNTFAPYLLTKRLLPIIPKDGRVVNLSSAAQAPINPNVIQGTLRVDDMGAYAQSKLAITIWTRELAKELAAGPVMVAVNPGSLLASKMVKEGFGVAGNDLNIGADILCDAALGDRFADASGKYFDNDRGQFAEPHPAAFDEKQATMVMKFSDQYATQ